MVVLSVDSDGAARVMEKAPLNLKKYMSIRSDLLNTMLKILTFLRVSVTMIVG